MAYNYSQDLIQEVLDRTDIVDLVSEYLPLKKRGSSYMGLCPFHNEKTPSFHVSQEKGLFHCFGCGSAGNSMHFLMKIDNLDFNEAMETLAKRASVELPQDREITEHQKQIIKQKEKILTINKEAALFYVRYLHKFGSQAMEYLKLRGLDITTIKKFGLGLAPASWSNLLEYLLKKGYTHDDLLQAGVILPDKTGKKYYDRFRNRIIFPIINHRSEVIGFGGRVMDDSHPKYLNSSDSPVFTKGNNLYNINLAKTSIKDGKLIIVEGYMDVIGLSQAGIHNVVASLGTALTINQAKLLKRYGQEIYLSYDSDSAGQSATIKGMEVLRQQGCKVKIVTLPQGKDPDEFVKIHGKQRFLEILESSKGPTDYKIELAYKRHNVSTSEGKGNFVKEISEALNQVDNRVELEDYINRISQKIQISPQALYSDLGLDKYKRQGNIYGNTRHNNQITKPKGLKPAHELAEENILNLIINNNDLYQIIKDTLSPEDYISDLHGKLAKIIYSYLDKGQEISESNIIANFTNPEDIKSIMHIIDKKIDYDDVNRGLRDFVLTITKYKRQLQIEDIKEEIGELMKRDSLQEFERQYLEQLNQTLKKLILGTMATHNG
jgi:DNA primase